LGISKLAKPANAGSDVNLGTEKRGDFQGRRRREQSNASHSGTKPLKKNIIEQTQAPKWGGKKKPGRGNGRRNHTRKDQSKGGEISWLSLIKDEGHM